MAEINQLFLGQPLREPIFPSPIGFTSSAISSKVSSVRSNSLVRSLKVRQKHIGISRHRQPGSGKNLDPIAMPLRPSETAVPFI
jgi:hypothetical protein